MILLRSALIASSLLIPLPAATGGGADAFELGPAPTLDGARATPPVEADAPASVGLAVDTSNRQAVVDFWNSVHVPTQGLSAGWTGQTGSCTAGTTDAVYVEGIRQRINWFRAMTGLPGNVTLDATLNAKDQEAALMMIAEGNLSHSPGTNWSCHTADGAEAAGNSNLALGRHGPEVISLYIKDSSANNMPVGHRRWILWPRQLVMGTGDTDGQSGFFVGSNALWVFGTFQPRPAAPEWVAWPPPGFVPYQEVYARWSVTRDGADFSGATVTMFQGATPISLNIIHTNGAFGDPAIVWEPATSLGRPSVDTPYTVTLDNVDVGGAPQTFAYTVTVIDPSAIPSGPDSEEIAEFLLGTGPDVGNLNVNGDSQIDCADLVRNILDGR